MVQANAAILTRVTGTLVDVLLAILARPTCANRLFQDVVSLLYIFFQSFGTKGRHLGTEI